MLARLHQPMPGAVASQRLAGGLRGPSWWAVLASLWRQRAWRYVGCPCALTLCWAIARGLTEAQAARLDRLCEEIEAGR